MLDRLGNKMETIDRAVQGLVAMEDSLKGEGGQRNSCILRGLPLAVPSVFQAISEPFYIRPKTDGRCP